MIATIEDAFIKPRAPLADIGNIETSYRNHKYRQMDEDHNYRTNQTS